jgi:hypothetical protein
MNNISGSLHPVVPSPSPLALSTNLLVMWYRDFCSLSRTSLSTWRRKRSKMTCWEAFRIYLVSYSTREGGKGGRGKAQDWISRGWGRQTQGEENEELNKTKPIGHVALRISHQRSTARSIRVWRFSVEGQLEFKAILFVPKWYIGYFWGCLRLSHVL